MVKPEIMDLSSKILCVGGSPRKGGNSDVLLEKLCSAFSGLNTGCELIQLREYQISPCIGCEKCRKDNICHGLDDDMQTLYPKIQSSKGMILVSPTHHYNITAWMKAFIDRMYCFYRFENTVPRAWSSTLAGQGRKAAVLAICEQEDKKDMGFTLEAMQWPLQAFGYDLVDELAVFKVFKKAGVKKELSVMDQIPQIAENMVRAVKE